MSMVLSKVLVSSSPYYLRIDTTILAFTASHLKPTPKSLEHADRMNKAHLPCYVGFAIGG